MTDNCGHPALYVTDSTMRSERLPCLFCERDQLRALLKAVQSDAGNWLHQDLQDAIEKAVGPAAPYRPLGDSGVATV